MKEFQTETRFERNLLLGLISRDKIQELLPTQAENDKGFELKEVRELEEVEEWNYSTNELKFTT